MTSGDEFAEQFGQRPFVAGTVTGLRCFKVDHSGHLRGVVHRQQAWVDGENIARCYQLVDLQPEEHRIGGADCSCGFYGYFGRANDYALMLGYGVTVTGIIEAYGTVSIGSRGFRASKARIVAFVAPDCVLKCAWGCSGPMCVLKVTFANYPSVPVYRTLEDALAVHPTTRPEDVGFAPDESGRSAFPLVAWQQQLVQSFSAAVTPLRSAMQAVTYAQRSYGATPSAVIYDETLQGPVPRLRRSRRAPVRKSRRVPEVVARRRASREAAAEARERAGLSNLGGIRHRK